MWNLAARRQFMKLPVGQALHLCTECFISINSVMREEHNDGGGKYCGHADSGCEFHWKPTCVRGSYRMTSSS